MVVMQINDVNDDKKQITHIQRHKIDLNIKLLKL